MLCFHVTGRAAGGGGFGTFETSRQSSRRAERCAGRSGRREGKVRTLMSCHVMSCHVMLRCQEDNATFALKASAPHLQTRGGIAVAFGIHPPRHSLTWSCLASSFIANGCLSFSCLLPHLPQPATSDIGIARACSVCELSGAPASGP